MAYKRVVKEQAENLYIIEGKSVKEIATILNVGLQTIYNWKNKYEWDKTIRASGTIGLSMEMTKSLANEINKAIAGGKLSDPKTADALYKSLMIAEKIAPKKVMLSNIYNMLEDITHYIQFKLGDEQFLMLWAKYVLEISDELRNKYSSGNALKRESDNA